MLTSVDVPVLLDSFVAIAAEHDEQSILERVVNLARLSTRARCGASLLSDGQSIGSVESSRVPRGPTGWPDEE